MNKTRRVETILDEREYERLEEYCLELDMSQSALLRQAFRIYDSVKNDLFMVNPDHPAKSLSMMSPLPLDDDARS